MVNSNENQDSITELCDGNNSRENFLKICIEYKNRSKNPNLSDFIKNLNEKYKTRYTSLSTLNYFSEGHKPFLPAQQLNNLAVSHLQAFKFIGYISIIIYCNEKIITFIKNNVQYANSDIISPYIIYDDIEYNKCLTEIKNAHNTQSSCYIIDATIFNHLDANKSHQIQVILTNDGPDKKRFEMIDSNGALGTMEKCFPELPTEFAKNLESNFIGFITHDYKKYNIKPHVNTTCSKNRNGMCVLWSNYLSIIIYLNPHFNPADIQYIISTVPNNIREFIIKMIYCEIMLFLLNQPFVQTMNIYHQYTVSDVTVYNTQYPAAAKQFVYAVHCESLKNGKNIANEYNEFIQKLINEISLINNGNT
jgi:hypothetical protein